MTALNAGAGPEGADAAALPRRRRLRRQQRDADVGRHLGRGDRRFAHIGPATVALLHWVSALIAMPAIAYAGRPFFGSAFAALRQGRTNMDVPISIGVLLVTGMSLVADDRSGGAHTYFDSAVTLLFFLLIGRVLDHRARGRARATAEQLLTLRMTDVAVLHRTGRCGAAGRSRWPRATASWWPPASASASMASVESGAASLDASLVTGESLPVAAEPGAAVFAGSLNLGAPLTVRATATGGVHAARRMRAADRGGRGAARPVRRAGRPGGAALCADGACLRAGRPSCGGSSSPACRLARRC